MCGPRPTAVIALAFILMTMLSSSLAMMGGLVWHHHRGSVKLLHHRQRSGFHASSLSLRMAKRGKDDDNIIDAEIVREENLPGGGSNSTSPSLSSLGSGLANVFSSVSSSISKAFGSKESEEGRKKRLMNTQIDKMVKETGIGGFAGMMIGGLIKTVGAALAQQISESAGDYERISGLVASSLRGDEQASRLLGGEIDLSNPVSSSSSSYSINGVSTKQMQYIIPLRSHAGSYVQVTASISNSKVSIEKLILQSGGGTFFVKVSGGGRGGVIDV